MKKTSILRALTALFAAVALSSATGFAATTTNSILSGDYGQSSTWSDDVPAANIANISSGHVVTLNDGITTYTATTVNVGNNSNGGTFRMGSGCLTLSGDLWMAGTGTNTKGNLNVFGSAYLKTANVYFAGRTASIATFQMTGGTIDTGIFDFGRARGGNASGTMSSGLIKTSGQFRVATASGANATLSLTGGKLEVATDLAVGSSGGKGDLSIGGSNVTTVNLYVGQANTAALNSILTVKSNNIQVDVSGTTYLRGNSTLNFALGADDAFTALTTKDFTISTAAGQKPTISVDLTAFEGSLNIEPISITLMSATGTLTNSTNFTQSFITNDDTHKYIDFSAGVAPLISWIGSDLVLTFKPTGVAVPEPSAYAVLLGALALFVLALRRWSKG